MDAVSDIDRQAAEELRAVLALLSGFWHLPGDAGPLCAALARHRVLAERRLLERLAELVPEKEAPGAGISGRLAFQIVGRTGGAPSNDDPYLPALHENNTYIR